MLPSVIFFPGNTTGILTCDEIDYWAENTPLFPVQSANYTLNATLNTTGECPCNSQLNSTSARVGCEDPLIASDTGCTFVCPLPSFTDNEYESAKIMQGIVAWTAWVCSRSFPELSNTLNPLKGVIFILDPLLSNQSKTA